MKPENIVKIHSKDACQTFNIGKNLGRNAPPGTSIALRGDLGTGKTTFVQGFARGVGISEKYYITSPTFNIINQYPVDSFILCHLDLYRLGSIEELEYTGFDDLVGGDNIFIVEWPELLNEIGFKFNIEISFTFDLNYNRIISMASYGQHGKNLIEGSV